MTLKRLCSALGNTLFAAIVIGLFAAPTLAGGQGPYKIKDRWTIGGEGGWDYLAVDSKTHRLYVTHGTRLEVLDLATGKPVGSINELKGIHGVAFDADGKFGYVSDGGANSVVVFDLASLQKVAAIPVGTNPDGIAYEPKTKTVWAFNGRSSNVTVIDTVKRSVVATIALPGKPEFPVADGTGIVFANIEDKNEIVRLDAGTNQITATWPLSGCDSPSGLAIDVSGRRLFSVCDGKKMAVTNANTGKSLATPTIGDSPDATGYDPEHKVAFSSNGDGTLTVIDASGDNYPVLQTLPTQRGARTMALDTATGRVFVVTAEFGPTPAATATMPHPRRTVLPGTFSVIVIGRE